MLRRFASVPASTVFAAVAVKSAASGEDRTARTGPDQSAELSHYNCKPSELPLYAPLHSYNKPKREEPPQAPSPVRNALESGVRVVRTEVQSGVRVITKQTDKLADYFQTAKEHSQATIDYLNQPHNMLPRTGAIAIGGLSGFIFAARGGFIKKVLYTTLGAGAVASICYPRQAEKLACDALFEARKGYAIAYNFVKGVKPGEGMPVEPINKFPTTLQEVKFLMWDLYDEAKETLFPKKK